MEFRFHYSGDDDDIDAIASATMTVDEYFSGYVAIKGRPGWNVKISDLGNSELNEKYSIIKDVPYKMLLKKYITL